MQFVEFPIINYKIYDKGSPPKFTKFLYNKHKIHSTARMLKF